MTSRVPGQTPRHPDLRQLSTYFLKLGGTGFGGPIALVGLMQRDLTERRNWFDAEEFRRGVSAAVIAMSVLLLTALVATAVRISQWEAAQPAVLFLTPLTTHHTPHSSHITSLPRHTSSSRSLPKPVPSCSGAA